MAEVPIWHNLTDIQRTDIIFTQEKSEQKKDSFLIKKSEYASGPYTHYFFWDANRHKEAA